MSVINPHSVIAKSGNCLHVRAQAPVRAFPSPVSLMPPCPSLLSVHGENDSPRARPQEPGVLHFTAPNGFPFGSFPSQLHLPRATFRPLSHPPILQWKFCINHPGKKLCINAVSLVSNTSPFLYCAPFAFLFTYFSSNTHS